MRNSRVGGTGFINKKKQKQTKTNRKLALGTGNRWRFAVLNLGNIQSTLYISNM